MVNFHNTREYPNRICKIWGSRSALADISSLWDVPLLWWHAAHDISSNRIVFHLQHQALKDVLKYFNCLKKVLRLGIGSPIHVYDMKRGGYVRRRLRWRGKWEVKDEEGGRGTGPQRASDRCCFFPPGANHRLDVQLTTCHRLMNLNPLKLSPPPYSAIGAYCIATGTRSALSWSAHTENKYIIYCRHPTLNWNDEEITKVHVDHFNSKILA